MMNRFRKNKKAKEPDNAEDASTFALKPKKKEESPEPAPALDFDLSAALPSSDNFRTSLLMPKLSARFSMLKEQDDPLSLMGKANDDSVLFPKRASRLNLFGHNPAMLADIEETSSNDGSRPSFGLGRTDSFASGGEGYGTDDDRSQGGSIMSRARRVEGNNLFGGRQKIYKIPVRPGDGSPDTESSRRGMGKAVYEHDINMSAFQRLRLKEKEERAEAAARESGYAASTASSNISKGTYSSGTSGPPTTGSLSTAPTSVDDSPLHTSQGAANGYPFPETQPEAHRPGSAMSGPRNGSIRSRRLYGQGLTQSAQNQQSSTLHRLESLSRQRAGTPDLPSLNRNYSRSATNLRDRLQKLAIVEPASTAGPTSPPSSATSPKPRVSGESAFRDRLSPTAATFGATPPLSPPTSENDEVNSLLAASIHPEDHGKATAMGLFNRPATGFDEQAFSRRQLEMHQGRETPPPRRSSPPRRPLPTEPAVRARGLSKSSYRSRAESASSHYSSDAHRGGNRSRASSIEASPFRPGVTSFYAASTNSESGDEGEQRELSSATSLATEKGQSLHNHGVASNKPSTPSKEQLEPLPEVRYSDLGDLKPIDENELDLASSHAIPDDTPKRPDSPTLNLDQGLGGMGGLVRSHLRQQSDKSSIFSPPSPRLPQHKDAPIPTIETDSRSHSNFNPSEAQFREEVRPASSHRPGTSSSHAPSGHSAERSRSSEDSSAPGTIADNASISNGSSWREELENHHRRQGSTETQREREEFAIELAERRRKVQEKLRSVAESESRSGSPTPGRSTPDFLRTGNAFAMLKQKSTKLAAAKQDHRKIFGYGADNSSTPALPSDDSWREEERPSFGFGRHSNSSSPHVGSERSLRSRMPSLSRNNSHEDSRESSRSRTSSPFRSQRDRAGSDASGRSKSRTRLRERDDLQTVDEGSVSAHGRFVLEGSEPPMPISRPGSTRPSAEIEPLNFDRAPSTSSGRHRSTSRSGTPSFHYERPYQFSQSNTPSIIGASPRPPPAAPAYVANATPPLNDAAPDASSTSLVSVASNASTIPQRGPGSGSLLKRPVNKKQISEPTFVSSTSNVPLVGLPPGTNQSSGSAPPLPPMNPRRRRGTATQTILSAFKHERPDSRAASPVPQMPDDQPIYPGEDSRPQSRNRLRKMSSEGASLHARARQESMNTAQPAIPHYPPPSIPADGGMF
ncbi:hypothetical protein N7541_010653 [Penicillium brevicompactum]|uniref:Uncharacterized protein n=1 Tax=Penicillium brevicompactum TaxID=5074 RepID=A0A9W9QRB9_PENBR|nr:hypothetical protein N7541_010653 [Penicillium brevicompactum]